MHKVSCRPNPSGESGFKAELSLRQGAPCKLTSGGRVSHHDPAFGTRELQSGGSVALAIKSALLDGFVRSDGKNGVGHRRCSRKGSGESTAPTCLGPPLNATDPLVQSLPKHCRY